VDLKRLPARFYRNANGREPVREWLKELPPVDRRIIGEDIKDVEFAWPLGLPLVTPAWPRPVGSTKLAHARQDRTNHLLRDGWPNGFAARLHQEDADDTGAGNRLGLEKNEGRRSMKKKNIGSSFDDWLREEGIYEETTAVAIKRVLARQISQEMIDRKLSKSDMARRMQTSRAALDRLLDPENDAVTLNTLSKAATAVGRQLHFELI
jgi:antitoxin HicB